MKKPLKRSTLPKGLDGIKRLEQLRPGQLTGVYFLCRGSRVVYVGQSSNYIFRLQGHKDKQYDRIFFKRVHRGKLRDVERRFICLLKPELNVWRPKAVAA